MFTHNHPKFGGRQKGTPNKASLEFRQKLEELDFFVPEKLVALYNQIPFFHFGLKISLLKVIASFAYSRPNAAAHIQQLDEIAESKAETENDWKDLARLLPRRNMGNPT